MLSLFADLLPEALRPYQTWVFALLGAVVALIVVVLIGRTIRRRPGVDPEAVLDENLAEYPPAPTGAYRLRFDGQPVRVRLVVFASPGRVADVTSDNAEDMLESILYGMGTVVRFDKPRVKIWPPQLSQSGFAPKFYRRVHLPGPKGEASRYILVAGPARAGAKTILLGLVLECREPSPRGTVSLSIPQWVDRLRVNLPE